jgi:hypothetical protein
LGREIQQLFRQELAHALNKSSIFANKEHSRMDESKKMKFIHNPWHKSSNHSSLQPPWLLSEQLQIRPDIGKENSKKFSFGGMDEMPVRRSLRVAGMTPLRPMSSIMFDQQNRDRSPTRTRNRPGTPNRGKDSQAPPDSRARQVLNLPSDISSSDFLGDTPTARFHKTAAPTQAPTATVIARRTTTTAPVTVKARKMTKRNSNVFLNQEGTERETGMISMTFLSAFRIIGWMLSSAKSFAIFFLCLPSFAIKSYGPSVSKFGLWIIGAISVGIVLYALSQLDLTVGRGKNGHSVRPPPRQTTVNRSADLIVEPKDIQAINANFKQLRARLLELEASLNEVKATMSGADVMNISSVQSLEGKLQGILVKDAELEATVRKLEERFSEMPLNIPPVGVDPEIRRQLDALKNAVNTLKLTVGDVQEKLTFDVLRNSIRREVSELLPESLLVRKAPDGTILIDPRLLEVLHEHFQAQGSTTVSSTTSNGEQARSVNVKALENLFNGKLSQLQHQIVERDQIAEMIAEGLSTELKRLSLVSHTDHSALSNAFDEKLSHIESSLRGQQLTSNDIANLVKAQLAKDLPADGVGMADYALESMGTRVVTSGTARSYGGKSRGLFAEFLHIGSRAKPPRVALLPDNSLGNCWAFQGNRGNLTIALGTAVIPSHISIDHIPASLRVNQSSAPKLFEVYGLNSPRDEPVLIGQYGYRLDGPAVQTFAAQYIVSRPVRFVRLTILSNHGNPDYTCLYRFRVHSVNIPDVLYEDSQ